jgi:hypothetical protein
MTNPIITICDLLSGETIIREMTNAEFAAHQASQTEPTVEETENV